MRSSDHQDPAQKSGKGRRLFAVCGLLSLPGLYLYFILQMLFGRNTSACLPARRDGRAADPSVSDGFCLALHAEAARRIPNRKRWREFRRKKIHKIDIDMI